MLGYSPSSGTKADLHRFVIPVLAAGEVLGGGIVMHRLDQLGSHTSAPGYDTLHAHQGAQIRCKKSSGADVLMPKADTVWDFIDISVPGQEQ